MKRRRDSPEWRGGGGGTKPENLLKIVHVVFVFSLQFVLRSVTSPTQGRVTPGMSCDQEGEIKIRAKITKEIMKTKQKAVGVSFDIYACFLGIDFCSLRHHWLDRTGAAVVLCRDVM